MSQGAIFFPSFIISFSDMEIVSQTNPFKLQEVGQGIVRRVGVFGIGPVGLSSIILGTLPLFLFKASVHRSKLGHKILYVFLFGSGIFVIFFTYSRSAMAALVLSLFLYVVFLKKNRLFNIVFFAALIFLIGLQVPYLTQRIKEMIQPYEGSFANHLYLWLTALSVWRQNPFLGTGLGTFAHVAVNYNPLYYISFFSGNSAISDTHNMLLQILAENGAIGLFMFLWFLYCIIKYGIKAQRLGTADTLLIKALAVCFLATFLMGLTLNDYTTETFWGLLGIVTCAFVAHTKEGNERKIKNV
jgi:O-antigen ligase